MRRKRQCSKPGTWFAVPLRSGGFARGIVARSSGKGTVFGYFFGQKLDLLGNMSDLESLSPSDSILIGQFGDRGLVRGEWEVLGEADNWDPSIWPLPNFSRIDEAEGTALKITLSEQLRHVSEEPCEPAVLTNLPEDSVMGQGYVEHLLTSMLS